MRLLLLFLFLSASVPAVALQQPDLPTLQRAFSQGKYPQALQVGRLLLQKSPNDTQVLLLTGATCIELARLLTDDVARLEAHKEALGYFKRYEILKPDHGDTRVHQSLARCYLVTKTKTEAMRHARTAVQLDPNSAMAQRLLGEAYAMMGNPDKALSALKKAQRLDPGNAEYIEAVQIQLHAMRRFGETLVFIEEHRSKILPDNQNQYLLHWVLHVTHLALNNIEESHKAILKAREKNPGRSLLLSPLTDSHYRIGDHEGAEKWADAALAHPRTTPIAKAAASRTKGQIRMHQGNYEEAKRLLESAIVVLNDDGPTTLALIATYRRLGEKELAKSLADKYRESLKEKP